MGTKPAPQQQPVAKPDDPIDLSESVAGEEDPGASIDVVGKRDAPAAREKQPPFPPQDKPRGGS